jgi:hypothetical protein
MFVKMLEFIYFFVNNAFPSTGGGGVLRRPPPPPVEGLFLSTTPSKQIQIGKVDCLENEPTIANSSQKEIGKMEIHTPGLHLLRTNAFPV